MYRSAGILETVANIVGLSSAFLFLNHELSSHGRRALVEGAFGRPAESARMGDRCLSRPETRLGRGHGAMVKQSFVSHRICIAPTTNGISSPHRIGRHSTRAMPIWVVVIRFLWWVRAATHP